MAHLKVESYDICQFVPDRPCDDPEDGITDTIEGMLNGRKLHTKIDNWYGLWKALFPNDSDNVVPTPGKYTHTHPRAHKHELVAEKLTSADSNQSSSPPWSSPKSGGNSTTQPPT